MRGLLAVSCFVLPLSAFGAEDSVAAAATRVAAGDASATGTVEDALAPLLARKDLWTLDAPAAVAEIARRIGPAVAPQSITWHAAVGGEGPMRLVTIDFASAVASGAGPKGYVAYAVIERSGKGEPSITWYHDTGKKVAEQAGAVWHPVALTVLDPGGTSRSAALAIHEAGAPAGPPLGVLILSKQGGAWSAARRLAPGAGAELIAVGPAGAVFTMPRTQAAGVLTGAPASLFRSLAWYPRTDGAFANDPVLAAIPDPVTAAEGLIAALRASDLARAKSLCAAPEAIEAMQYFSPTWTGGGRIVRADARTVEFVYEERERPTLRIELAFENRSGVLLLANATGRAEPGKP